MMETEHPNEEVKTGEGLPPDQEPEKKSYKRSYPREPQARTNWNDYSNQSPGFGKFNGGRTTRR